MSAFPLPFSIPDSIMLLLSLCILISWPISYAIFTLSKKPSTEQKLNTLITRHCSLPALLILICFGIELFHHYTDVYAIPVPVNTQIFIMQGVQILRSALSLWLLIWLSDSLYLWLHHIAIHKRPIIQSILPQIKNSLKFSFVALLFILLIPDFIQTDANTALISKASSLLIITAITWSIIQLINAFEQLTLQRYQELSTDNYKARGIYTKARVFKKFATAIIVLLAFAASLTVFDSVRQLGASLLASAGLVTVVVGIAAQKTLGNLFAGLQIAISQPIKINDALIIEGEFGTVEEITLTYVIVKLWDLRRMVLPINYFLEKPFQNWTRKTASLLCPVFIYTDFSLPLAPIREAFMKILSESEKWDKAVACLQVSDATANVMQLRALASAKDAGTAWNLRCEIREKLIAFIAKNYPHCLPRVRQENSSNNKFTPYEFRSERKNENHLEHSKSR